MSHLDLHNLTVFPLFPVTATGSCTCSKGKNCPSPAKHPYFQWANLHVGEKLGGPEGCGYGIATGHRSGFFVVDLDIREGKNGLEAFQKLGGCNATYTVRTPTGGLHLYFQLPNFLVRNSANELAPGIDIRGEGGFVVGQDSTHRNGGKYALAADEPLATAPQWLLDWAGLKGAPTVADREAGELAPIPIDISTPEGDLRMADACDYLEAAPPSVEGQQGSVQLFRICIYLIRTMELPIQIAFSSIMNHYNARCEPPWSEAEIWHKLVDARDKVDRIPGPPTDIIEQLNRTAIPAIIKETQDNETSSGAGVRRIRDPKHAYTFTPGLNSASLELNKVATSEVAFLLAAHEDWAGVLQFDVFRRRIYAINPPLRMDAESGLGFSDADVAGIRMWFESKGYAVSKDTAFDAIDAAAKRCSFHPIIDYLKSCPAAPGIFDAAAARIFDTEDVHANDFLKKTMIAAVRRIITPGVKFDNMLTLYGPDEGEGKTLFAETLFGEEFYRSQMPSIDSKDASVALQGYWGVEFAELSRIIAADDETGKEFLSRRIDDFRPPYGRCEIHAPRCCVFIGTTNDQSFLRGAGRNRRWWPVAIGRSIDLAWLREHRNELWGEALALANAGERHWYTREEEVSVGDARDPFVNEDPWHDTIRDFLCGRDRVTVQEVYDVAICRGVPDTGKFRKTEQMSITDTLKRIGCRKVKSNCKSFWEIPRAIAALPKINLTQKFVERLSN